jgi:Uri superfamily endonuclease
VNRLYVVAAWVPRRETIVVGALGPVTFARGWYAYVGSARRGRHARVARHLRADKALRWHADYLFTAHPATRAWLLDTGLGECEVAALLGAEVAGAACAAPSFGASDCGCPGHLVRLPRRASAGSVRGVLKGCGRVSGQAARPETAAARALR